LPLYNTDRPYDDEKDGNTNIEKQELFTVHNPTTKTDTHVWFSGDVVPFQHCAYLVNFNNNAAPVGGAKTYSF